MVAYTIRRILLMIPLLFAVATVTFFLMHSVEGGPFDTEKPLSEAARQRLNERYDLDGTLLTQYVNYLQRTVQGDFGISFSNDRPVRDIIGDRFSVSIQLGISAFLFAVTMGLTLGIIAAINQNGIGDYVGVFIATSGAALPSFILAPFLVILFALKVDWFDVLGWELWNYKKMVLPTVALGMLPGAFVARIARASMLDILRQDYIRTARAKGVKETRVIIQHAVKNAMIPVLTVLGPIFAGLITGSFIVENAFAIPGLGNTFVGSVLIRDYGVIMGVTLFYAVVIAAMNLIVDLLYAVADPRIRL
ncbi:MAG: peptide ABC transporter permease [Anaerolinea sp.]|nr:peptide ABC transporter permease [Anaerolinea sp.]